MESAVAPTGDPDTAQGCSNFESTATPVDVMSSNSNGYVLWHADPSSGRRAVDESMMRYSGTYGEDRAGTMELDISATGPAVSGSFGLDTIDLQMLLSPAWIDCPTAGIVGKQDAVSGFTLTA